MQKIIYLKRFPGAICSLNWALSDSLLFYFIVFFFITSGDLGQRRPPEGTFTAAYFDSIRIQVYDTLKEHCTINAYRLADTDEIHIDGKFDEQAWKMAEHKGELLEKEPYPLVPMSEKTELLFF